MKKKLLLILSLIFSSAVFAQDKSRDYIINETFDSTELPEGWTSIGVDGNECYNWVISESSNAGGDANELRLSWYPQFFGLIRLVSTPVNLSGIQNIVFTMKHYFDNYSNAVSTIGIATSSDNGATWNNAWSEDYTITGRYEIEEKIVTPDLGHDNVLFCLYFDGASIDFDNWYFDDFTVSVQDELSLRLKEINLNERIGSGPFNLGFSVQNLGSSTVQSFVASYEIEGRTPVTETFTKNINSFETQDFSFTHTETLLPGNYEISLNIETVNGEEENPEDNALGMAFSVGISETQRIPMIEHFSSSTCAPCVGINTQMAELTEANPGKFTYVKYPANFPNQGDPYCIQESTDRRTFYGVSTVPLVFLDATAQLSNSTIIPVTEEALLERYNTPAFVNIKGAFNVEGNTINIFADVMSYIDINNVNTFISINEKVTTGNVSSNGETEFHHIIMKMIESSNGIATNLEAGKYKRFEYSVDMSETFVEEMSDLEVAVWVQDLNTKEIFNSNFLYENTEHPYAVNNLHFYQEEGQLTLKWDEPELTPTAYQVYINNELAADNISETSFVLNDAGDFCLAEVFAIYGDKTSVGSVVLYSSDFHTPENLNASANEEGISISWEATENATAYILYRDGEFLAEVNSTEYTDTELENDTDYCYRVSAIYDRFESALSEEVCKHYEGVNIEELETSLNITPNPACDNIRISGNGINEIFIYNSLGIMMSHYDIDNDNIDINIKGYKAGIYFVKISCDNNNVIKKIIKK